MLCHGFKINAGILDGDIAILEKTNNVVNRLVVALIMGKKLHLKGLKNSIALEPANKSLKPGYLV